MTKLPEKPILLVDDEQGWLSSMKAVLAYEAGFNNVIECSDSRKVLELMRQIPCSIVLLDLNMPYLSGKKLLPQIIAEFPTTQVLIISGMNQIDTAVDCVKEGAFNYIVKSSDMSQILISVHNALCIQSLDEENRRMRELFFAETLQRKDCFSHIYTQSKKLQKVFYYCESLATSSEPVLITGESGVGKELVAQALHKLYSPDGPFVTLNVAGLDDNVFSDTLFGHTKGAYTGATEARRGLVEKADHGILFLDEIGDLRLESQVKLLRLLQEHEYYPLGSDSARLSRTRFIFATNESLEQKVEEGSFRKDLFYRLNTHHICIPSLRERPEDISLLIDHYADEAAKTMGLKQVSVEPAVYKLLGSYSFPGNIRELRSMVFDATTQSRNGQIEANLFSSKIGNNKSEANLTSNEIIAKSGVIFSGPLPTLKEINRLLIDEALNQADGNHRKAASVLGLSRSALSKRLSKP